MIRVEMINATYTREEFIKEVNSYIDFAINDKEYAIEDLTPTMIAEDIVGYVDVDHGVDEEGMKIIKEELDKRRK